MAVEVLADVGLLMSQRYGASYMQAVPRTLREARLKFLREWRLVARARRSGVSRVCTQTRFAVLCEIGGKLIMHSIYSRRSPAESVAYRMGWGEKRSVVADLKLCRLRHGESTFTFTVKSLEIRMKEFEEREESHG